ncbi:MAG TPA: AMP-binding protein, partial [Solirubrobacterales bacterium]|nr:AMP-binding protein [Solirubrobacterales bacterium]
MVRSLAGKLSPDLVTRPMSQLGRRVKLGRLGPLSDVPFNVRTLAEAGVIRPVRPDKLALTFRVLARWGASPAAGITGAAINHPDQAMVEDEAGTLTFAEIHRRSNALARGLAAEGVHEGDGIAIMCRNHRGFVEATLAVSKLGANGLYMNTAFASPQLAGVVEREAPVALIYDAEFGGLLEQAAEAGSEIGLRRYVSWADGDDDVTDTRLEDLIEASDDRDLDPPDESSRFVILTSGTTGTPKGAQRGQPDTLGPLAAMFSKIPLRAGELTMIAAPLFHSWGFAHFTLGLALNSTYVLRRRFDPEETLRATQDRGATALVVVPVMIQRILELAPETLDRYDLSSLRVVAASGSALPGELATKWMDTFGDNLYNLYGSTEVAWATIATPEDLRAAPGTAGRPPRGTAVRIVDVDGNDVAPGKTGRVFVGNEMAFEGYTGGGSKENMGGLLSSGDVGHFDAGGRLFIDGRDDEMIVSGGENVFPREVEDLLADHAAVDDVAVIGVEDAQFGQRLKAFVVTAPDAKLGEADIKAHVKAKLARYKVPREVV